MTHTPDDGCMDSRNEGDIYDHGYHAGLAAAEAALRSALGLCDYLISVWPEIGSLPSVQSTRADVSGALGRRSAS